jgi:hypothetical protein
MTRSPSAAPDARQASYLWLFERADMTQMPAKAPATKTVKPMSKTVIAIDETPARPCGSKCRRASVKKVSEWDADRAPGKPCLVVMA